MHGNEISTRNHNPLDKYNYPLDDSKVTYPLHSTIHDINGSLLEKSNRFLKGLYLPMDSDFSTG